MDDDTGGAGQAPADEGPESEDPGGSGGPDRFGEDTSAQRLHDELLGVLRAVEERFGDREPSEEELQAFLRERLAREGRSDAEIDRIMGQL